MNDPYKVLKVSQTASDDEVKQAYRELVRKYHPDSYSNNPLADLANEKMQEINTAYDDILKMRSVRSSSANNGSYSSSSNSQFADIRQMLKTGMVTQALEVLEGVPVAARDGEWHFLKGTVFYNRGWLDEAYSHFRRAVDYDPNNPEYRAVLNRVMQSRQQGYNNPPPNYSSSSSCCGPCSICSTLMCADCTCSVCRCCF